jgi:hypothetical protein
MARTLIADALDGARRAPVVAGLGERVARPLTAASG